MPPKLHAPIRQDVLLLTRGKGRSGPAALLKYLRGDKARSIIKSFRLRIVRITGAMAGAKLPVIAAPLSPARCGVAVVRQPC